MSQNGNRRNQPPDNSWLSIEISVRNNQPKLLQGLDRWLELNLISDTQVKNICRQHLSCALPEAKVIKPTLATEQSTSKIKTQVIVNIPQKQNIINQLWQSFLDELSIRWLLFLGIFLVVVSSGVLAASQWDNFPKFGQYLILLIYTLGFWGTGFWSSKQANLKLTSQTLKAIAILLIPINFWAINRLGLGNNLLEWITIIIAFITLTGTTYFQFKLQRNNKYFVPFFLLLSYLHLGWQIDFISTLAIYGGITFISAIHYFRLLNQQKYPTTKLLFLFTAWLLLLLRELLGNNISIPNYFLAIALLGWLLATIYLTLEKKVKKRDPEAKKQQAKQITNAFLSNIFQSISIIILLVTWLFSVLKGVSQPLYFWQTVGISFLAIHLFGQRLTLYWRKQDLNAIFLIGLQTLYISKELVPDSFRSNALDLAVTVSQTEYFPESVFGVTLFPYVILFIGVATWLYRKQKPKLARHAEFLTLLLAIFLTSLSYVNPTWRSLNLFFSTITLGYVAKIRQPLRIPLIYVTHLVGLATIISGLAAIFPNLDRAGWGSILILLMVGEWFIYLRQVKQTRVKFKANFFSYFKQSSWYFGLLLSAISYGYFLSYITISSNTALHTIFWGLLWLTTPGMLTLIAQHTRKIKQRRLVTLLSCAGLIATQLLVLEQPVTRFIGLSIAITLMFVNAFNLRRIIVTVIHVGFGLSLIIGLVYDYVTRWNWLIIGAIIILGLYWFRRYLQQTLDSPKFSYVSQRIGYGRLGVGTEPQNGKLIRKYIKATDYWATVLITVEIALLSLIYGNFAQFNSYPQYLLSIILILGAIIWRYQQQPNNLVLYGVVWLVELLAIGVISILGGNDVTFALTNIILGFFALGFVSRIAKANSVWATLNLSYIPIIYAVLGIFWRLYHYNNYTGLLTLGAAFILIHTQQRERQINSLTSYLGFAGISFGIYETVIYQMQQSSGGSAADGLTILALVAAAIAFFYRLGAWWYRQRHQTTMFALALPQVILIAHIHWAVSSILKIIAASIAIESVTPRLTPLSIATSFCLGAYAIIQGKDNQSRATNSNTANDWWVYVGLVEIFATLVYSRLIITKLSLFDPWRVIITCLIALAIYQIPWHNLGWRATPWQRTAVIIPALMTLVTAEDVSYLSLLATALFYLRIAYYQKNLRWSYLSLGFLNWGIIRLVWQYNTESIWLAAIISLSILYIAQFDPDLKFHRQQRHFVRLVGCSVLCIVALFYQDTGIIPSLISLGLLFIGLGFKIRAFLFTGTITLILTVIYQLVILVLTYSFLKWIVGLLAGVCLIIVAGGFEKQREVWRDRLQSYNNRLHYWQ